MLNCIIVGAGNKSALSDAPGTWNEHKYLSYCHAIKDNPNFAISEIYDINAEATALAYNIWGEGNGKHIDIGIVASSDDSHYSALKSLATMDVRLVICEKPLCNTVAQAREIVELYRKKGIPLMVDYTRRFIPEWRSIKDDIDEGLYGKFIKGYCYYNRGKLHTLSHFLDMALWYNGNTDNIVIQEVEPTYQWVYQWGLFYENNFASEHAVNLKRAKVNTIYDNHLKFLMENAYNFLQKNEPLYCDGDDGLMAIEECFRIYGDSHGV